MAAASPTRPSRPTSSAGRPAAGTDDPHPRRRSATSARRSSSRSGSPRHGRAGGAASTTSSGPRVIFPIRDQNGHAVGLGGRLLEGDGPKYLNSPGDAALRQEPDALPDRQGQGSDPKARPGGHRRGLHRRADGPPGRLRQRRRQPRHGAHARAGRAADPVREADRARVRRRCGRREGRHARGDRARRADPPAPVARHRGQARGRPRRAAARRQGPRRGRARVARGVGRPSARPSRSSST